jgi:hypothetical protein
MNLCDAEHPEYLVFCNRPGDGAKANHPYHSGVHGSDYVDWDNNDYIPPKTKSKDKSQLKDMATRIRNS